MSADELWAQLTKGKTDGKSGTDNPSPHPSTSVPDPQPAEVQEKEEGLINSPSSPLLTSQPPKETSNDLFSLIESEPVQQPQPKTEQPIQVSKPDQPQKPANDLLSSLTFPSTEQPTPKESNPTEYDLSPSDNISTLNKMVYGDKGGGKTVLALSEVLEDKTICAISLDEQTQIIHQEIYNLNPKITVYDGLRYYSEEDPTIRLESSVKTLEYLIKLLTGPIKKQNPDIIVIDGTEVLNGICEMVMRARNNIQMAEGFKNLNLWKERNMYMNQIHRLCTLSAKEGVTYTAYGDIEEITTATGETKHKGPKWAGDIKMKTQIVINVSGETFKDGRVFYATVESSKLPSKIPTSGKKEVGKSYNNGTIEIKGMKALRRGEKQ